MSAARTTYETLLLERDRLEAFRWLAGHPDAREGVAVFREKRASDWPAIAKELPW
ncbi:MAG: hypothetical protein ACRD0V_04565 [Acidimicrobiales bacterium]